MDREQLIDAFFGWLVWGPYYFAVFNMPVWFFYGSFKGTMVCMSVVLIYNGFMLIADRKKIAELEAQIAKLKAGQ